MKEPLSREELMAQARLAARSAYTLLIPADNLTFTEADRLLDYALQMQEAAVELRKRPTYKRGR